MSGWIGVDLDGTLAVYRGWKGPGHIGDPVPAMVRRVKGWLAEGREVRIFSARVAASGKINDDGVVDGIDFADEQRRLIQDWCEEHLGARLEVTATKDCGMIELWDDRCIQVIPNTGVPAVTPSEHETYSPRRLSTEWRQNRQAELDEEREGGALIALELELDDALHDLDLADREPANTAKQIRADERRKFGEQAARVVMDVARGPEDDEVLQRAQDEIRALVIQPDREQWEPRAC